MEPFSVEGSTLDVPAARMTISEIPRFRVFVAVVVISNQPMDLSSYFESGSLRLTLVCAFLELTVVRGLLDEVEDGLRKSLVGDGPC